MIEGLVSVVITTYGRNINLLFQAIESVRKQTYEYIELIVVDDNGLGTSIQQQNELKFVDESGIQYIVNKENRGVQYSRNIGILESKGEFIAFLDDDDIWMPEKIEKQVSLLKKNDLGMVFCNGYRFYDNDLNKRKLYQYNFISEHLITFDIELESDRIGSTSHPLIRKECLAQTGLFDLDMPARQDYEMWLRICKYFKVQGINEPLFYYRYHDGERITASTRKDLFASQLLWKKYKSAYKKNKKARGRAQLGLALYHFKMKNFFHTFYHGCYAFMSSPSTIVRLFCAHRKNRNQF